MDKSIYLSVFVLVTLASLGNSYSQQGDELSSTTQSEQSDIEVKLVLDESSRNRHLVASSMTPVVFWHGMGDTAYGSINVDRIALQRKYPGLAVLSVQIGGNVIEDELSGYFVNVNYQIESVCREILSNSLIRARGSFNAIGFSQGGQFLRGLIQRCPLRENGIKVKNFISLGGQHQGVYGLPKCFNRLVCDHIRYLLSDAVYTPSVQDHLVQAEYWHDPVREDEYKSRNVFLADINNENHINETYRNNLSALKTLVLVKFNQDDIVVPRESSLFGYYAPGQSKRLITLEETDLYKEDRLGLKKLHDTNRLRMISIEGNHLQYKMNWFMNNIASVYLNN